MTGNLIGAIEAGGTKFVLAVASPDGAVLERLRVPTRTPSETRNDVVAWFREACAAHGRIAAFGIGSFGPIGIDPDRPDYGIFTTTPKAGWTGENLRQWLTEFEVPIALDTDVNAAALGEWLRGAGRGCNSLAYTTVGTGIGSGVLNCGASMRGFSHYEAGHLLVRQDRDADPFGGVCPFHANCLEGLASGPAILARWGHDLSSASPEQVTTIADYVAQLAAALVLLHRPDRLVFGGGVVKAPGFIAALRLGTRVKLAGYIAEWDEDLSQRIVPPELEDDAGIVGAIELGRRALEKVTDPAE